MITVVSAKGEKKEELSAASCLNCSKNASVYCSVCGDMCNECSTSVHEIPILKSHLQHIVPLQAKPVPDRKCAEHDEKMKLYCVNCQVLACSLCKEFGNHSNHSFKLIAQVSAEAKDSLKAQHAEVSALFNELMEATSKILEDKQQAQTNEAKLHEESSAALERVMTALQSRVELLKQKTTELTQTHQSELKEQRAKIVQCLSEVASVDTEVKDLLSKDDGSIVSAKAIMSAKLEELKKQCQDARVLHFGRYVNGLFDEQKVLAAVRSWGDVLPPARLTAERTCSLVTSFPFSSSSVFQTEALLFSSSSCIEPPGMGSAKMSASTIANKAREPF